MSDEKKTEEELRHDVRRDFGFSEKTDAERIDKALQMKKDRYTATQGKKKAQEELETAKKANKQDPNKGTEADFSLTDIRVLSNVKHDEDVETIVNYSKANNISIAEAKKHKDISFILKGRDEERKTADASNTGGSRRSSSKKSDEDIIKDFDKGVVDDSDKGIARLVKAQMDAKQAKKRT